MEDFITHYIEVLGSAEQVKPWQNNKTFKKHLSKSIAKSAKNTLNSQRDIIANSELTYIRSMLGDLSKSNDGAKFVKYILENRYSIYLHDINAMLGELYSAGKYTLSDSTETFDIRDLIEQYMSGSPKNSNHRNLIPKLARSLEHITELLHVTHRAIESAVQPGNADIQQVTYIASHGTPVNTMQILPARCRVIQLTPYNYMLKQCPDYLRAVRKILKSPERNAFLTNPYKYRGGNVKSFNKTVKSSIFDYINVIYAGQPYNDTKLVIGASDRDPELFGVFTENPEHELVPTAPAANIKGSQVLLSKYIEEHLKNCPPDRECVLILPACRMTVLTEPVQVIQKAYRYVHFIDSVNKYMLKMPHMANINPDVSPPVGRVFPIEGGPMPTGAVPSTLNKPTPGVLKHSVTSMVFGNRAFGVHANNGRSRWTRHVVELVKSLNNNNSKSRNNSGMPKTKKAKSVDGINNSVSPLEQLKNLDAALSVALGIGYYLNQEMANRIAVTTKYVKHMYVTHPENIDIMRAYIKDIKEHNSDALSIYNNIVENLSKIMQNYLISIEISTATTGMFRDVYGKTTALNVLDLTLILCKFIILDDITLEPKRDLFIYFPAPKGNQIFQILQLWYLLMDPAMFLCPETKARTPERRAEIESYPNPVNISNKYIHCKYSYYQIYNIFGCIFSDNALENHSRILAYYPEYSSVLALRGGDWNETIKAIITYIFDNLSSGAAECKLTLKEFITQCLYVSYMYQSIVSVKYSFSLRSMNAYTINGFKIDTGYAIMFGISQLLSMFDIDMSDTVTQAAIKFQIDYITTQWQVTADDNIEDEPKTKTAYEKNIAVTLLKQLLALYQQP